MKRNLLQDDKRVIILLPVKDGCTICTYKRSFCSSDGKGGAKEFWEEGTAADKKTDSNIRRKGTMSQVH